MVAPPVTDHAVSIRGYALRVSALSAAGVPLTGTSGSIWVSNLFTQVQATPTMEAGDDFVSKAANGSLCALFHGQDTMKYATLQVDICNPEPELTALLAGGSVLTPGVGQAASGYASPQIGQIGNVNGVALEVWAGAFVNGRPSPTYPFTRWVFPQAYLVESGARMIGNGIMATTFTGYGYGNTGFGSGPVGDWTFGAPVPYQYARDTATPTILNGFVS